MTNIYGCTVKINEMNVRVDIDKSKKQSGKVVAKEIQSVIFFLLENK